MRRRKPLAHGAGLKLYHLRKPWLSRFSEQDDEIDDAFLCVGDSADEVKEFGAATSSK
jgi:hypothetical protein